MLNNIIFINTVVHWCMDTFIRRERLSMPRSCLFIMFNALIKITNGFITNTRSKHVCLDCHIYFQKKLQNILILKFQHTQKYQQEKNKFEIVFHDFFSGDSSSSGYCLVEQRNNGTKNAFE